MTVSHATWHAGACETKACANYGRHVYRCDGCHRCASCHDPKKDTPPAAPAPTPPRRKAKGMGGLA